MQKKIVGSNLNFLYPYLSKSNYHVWKYYFWLSVLSLPSTDKSYFEIRGAQVNPFLYRSSFRRPTLLASPTPKYCFKGVGKAGPKNEGEAEIVFFINFHAIFEF